MKKSVDYKWEIREQFYCIFIPICPNLMNCHFPVLSTQCTQTACWTRTQNSVQRKTHMKPSPRYAVCATDTKIRIGCVHLCRAEWNTAQKKKRKTDSRTCYKNITQLLIFFPRTFFFSACKFLYIVLILNASLRHECQTKIT